MAKCWFSKCENEATETIDVGDDAGQVLREVCVACMSEKFI